MLETIAAVPGMVGGTLQHLRSLRRMEGDRGWIHTLLEEAENERMHLMTVLHITRPTAFERLLIPPLQPRHRSLRVRVAGPRTAHALL